MPRRGNGGSLARGVQPSCRLICSARFQMDGEEKRINRKAAATRLEQARLLCGVWNADVGVTPQPTARVKRPGEKFGVRSVWRGMQEGNHFSFFFFFFNSTISKAPLSAAALHCPRQRESIFSASSSQLLTESEKTAAKGNLHRGSGLGGGVHSFFVPFFFLKFHLKLTY